MQELSFHDSEFIVSKTDLGGRITYGNALFIQISGYGEKELLGAPHNILRHPEMPAIVFKLLWETIKSGEEILIITGVKKVSLNLFWVKIIEHYL